MINRVEPVPEGWFTIADYMQENEVSRSKAFEDLRRLVKIGSVVSKKHKVLNINNSIQNISIYKIK